MTRTRLSVVHNRCREQNTCHGHSMVLWSISTQIQVFHCVKIYCTTASNQHCALKRIMRNISVSTVALSSTNMDRTRCTSRSHHAVSNFSGFSFFRSQLIDWINVASVLLCSPYSVSFLPLDFIHSFAAHFVIYFLFLLFDDDRTNSVSFNCFRFVLDFTNYDRRMCWRVLLHSSTSAMSSSAERKTWTSTGWYHSKGNDRFAWLHFSFPFSCFFAVSFPSFGSFLLNRFSLFTRWISTGFACHSFSLFSIYYSTGDSAENEFTEEEKCDCTTQIWCNASNYGRTRLSGEHFWIV